MMSPEVVERNFLAVNQFMKDMRAEMAQLHDKISGLQGTVSTQQSELIQLRQQNAILQARLMGTGATSGDNG